MRGETVIARAFGGVALVLRVWSIGVDVIYLANEQNFEKLQANEESLPPIGFPKADVFQYQSGFIGGKATDWRRLKPFRGLTLAQTLSGK